MYELPWLDSRLERPPVGLAQPRRRRPCQHASAAAPRAVANTDYSAGLTLEACEHPPWLDQSDPLHPVYTATNPHYLSGALNIVGVFVLLVAQLMILFVYSPLDTIYSYATDKKVANLVFLDDYIRVPDTDTAICQVTGSWSKTVPACLMSGCQVCHHHVRMSGSQSQASLM